MNRRSFLRRLVRTVAIATVAPAALTAVRPLAKARSITNRVGIYAQLQACKPVATPPLDLPSLFSEIYSITKNRKPSTTVDVFTDRKTARRFRAMAL